MPALASVVAKLMAIADGALECFVTVDQYTVGACNITRYSADVTACGEELTNSLCNMLFSLAEIANQLLGALAAT
jgi:hypothetical protein